MTDLKARASNGRRTGEGARMKQCPFCGRICGYTKRKGCQYVTPQQRIDAALDKVLKASGSALMHYALPGTLQKMREAMREVMSDSYIQGSNDARRILDSVSHTR